MKKTWSTLIPVIAVLVFIPALAEANNGDYDGGMAKASDPSAPDKAVIATDAGLMSSIGTAALDSIEKIPSQGSIELKIQLLINLAESQIRVGDMEGARRALTEARSNPQLPTVFTGDLFVQTFLAGDQDGAREFIQKFPAIDQVAAFGKLSTTQIKRGDTAGADKAVGLIDALYDKTPHEPPAQVRDPSRKPNFQDSHDSILGEVAKNFAMKGDIPHAQALAAKISNNGSLSAVLAEIAKAQHKVGDQHAADETLRQFKSDVDGFYGKDPVQAALIETQAFGVAGDTKEARSIAEALPTQDNRNLVLSRLSEPLARAGDMLHAREMADASGDDPDDLILIGKMQHNAGQDPDARATFLAAHESLAKQASMDRIERSLRVSQIVEGLISIGAFSDAISISAELDELNRPPQIVSAVREEIKRGDTQAIKETAPTALKIAETATLFNEKDLTDLSISLNKAGLTDNSKSILAIAQKNAGLLSGWQRMDALNSIKEAQVALGDQAGAAKTNQDIQQETAKFNNGIETASQQPSQTNDDNAAKAIKLMQQAQASNDPEEKKSIMQRALALVGNNGQMLESLMFISARYTSGLQKLQVVDENIAHNNFVAAMTIIHSMTGSGKDAGLMHLAQALAQAGQLPMAFGTANAIVDPTQRFYALIGVMNVGGKKTL
jgi:hypothetical protein